MATIFSLGPLRHLRAEPNQYILHYSAGKLVRQGAGLAYWFLPMSASVAMLPVEDAEATTLLHERTADVQAINVQVTVRYRVDKPELAAKRINFAISTIDGIWTEKPLEKLAAFFNQKVQEPVRASLSSFDLAEAVKTGADKVQRAVRELLINDAEMSGMGLAVVDVYVLQVSPSPEMEKALQTPARESMQQKADEAIFRRRADAVEKERAIKENELATEIELERRHAELIERRGNNKLAEVTRAAEADRLVTTAAIERENLQTTAKTSQIKLHAEAEAEAKTLIGRAEADGEAARAMAWKDIPNNVLLGLAALEFARKLQHIDHINVSPNMLSDLLGELLGKKLEK